MEKRKEGENKETHNEAREVWLHISTSDASQKDEDDAEDNKKENDSNEKLDE
jgi:hypothetical protein